MTVNHHSKLAVHAVKSSSDSLASQGELIGAATGVVRWRCRGRAARTSPAILQRVASVHRLALMRDWPDGALSWVCPSAAEQAQQDDALRTEFSISPRYFKPYSALLASFR